MEPESPSLLNRIRWGNVAWALAALAALGLVVAWPHLQRRGPGLPDETASARRDTTAQPAQPVQPIPPAPAAQPAPRPAPRPAVHPRRSTRRRRVAKPRARHVDRSRRRAPSAPPVPVPAPGGDGGGSSEPLDSGPAAPAGDQEFVPG